MAETEFRLTPFNPGDDGLAAEHAAVVRWIHDPHAGYNPRANPRANLELCAAGKALLDPHPAQACRCLRAAVVQARHWEEESGRQNAHDLAIRQTGGRVPEPAEMTAWVRRSWCVEAICALLSRSLPLKEGDLIALLDWCGGSGHKSKLVLPLTGLLRALRRFLEDQPASPTLREAMLRFAARMQADWQKESKQIGAQVEQWCCLPADSVPPSLPSERRPVVPAPAGDPLVLCQLKRHLGIPGALAEAEMRLLEPDGFPLRADSPLKPEHEWLSALLTEYLLPENRSIPQELKISKAGREILRADPVTRGRLLLAAAERSISAQLYDGPDDGRGYPRNNATELVVDIGALETTLDRAGLFDFLLFVASQDSSWHGEFRAFNARLFEQAGQCAAQSPLGDGERYVLSLVRSSLVAAPPFGNPNDAIAQLNSLIADGLTFYLVPGERWSDAIDADLTALAPGQRSAWVDLLRHCGTATAARPSEKWNKTGRKLIDAVGEDNAAARLAAWLPLVRAGRSVRLVRGSPWDRYDPDLIHEGNATCLRGMLWLVPLLPKSDDLLHALASVAHSSYRKVPGIGPRAVKVGNAAVYALSEMASPEAVGQLAMLKVRVRFGTAQKEIEKAFATSAEALGLPRDQIEEMGVPTYGLEEVGLRRESFGDDFHGELRIAGPDVHLSWHRADGKLQKSIPAKVKSAFKEELKELQGAAKDIAAMLPAQAQRLDGLFLQQKKWPFDTWRERYLNHPVVGTLARRLIWTFTTAAGSRAAVWLDGRLVDCNDAAVDPPPSAEVELWHPIHRSAEEILAWCRCLERHAITQPFKQAHREIYLLTDAERRTSTYSNRFAAHILRQHQFNALCAARGWKNKLRLMVDDEYPPAARDLPQWGLRAEFWIEGIGDNYGVDTNDAGVFLRLSTDQVRFYRVGAAGNRAHASGGGYVIDADGPGPGGRNAPVPLEEIPPLVFSEIMRDVDLFVGVASVGNDPEWQDGGPDGRYREYWNRYSFGDLSETARTRHAVLESLLPRLPLLRDRCSLEDRFLLVRGELRTYKIHLGSGNILMAPDDQYLCIVPGRPAGDQGKLFLPFEGDQTLSIVLSKAFLLAEDSRITDPTITRQIKRK